MPVLTVPELESAAKIVFDTDPKFDDAYFEFCIANPDLWIERNSQGEIVIVPPAGFESSCRSGDVYAQLAAWTKRNRNGKASDCSGEFLLPSGAGYAPDAAWVSKAKLARYTKEQLRKFPRLVPEFVVEVLSPSDTRPKAKKRCQEWIDEGVELAWLIDGDTETVWIYRPGQAPEKRTGMNKLPGEGPVDGFVLDLREIWAGL
jgi:Uma2 family endonuclease